MQLKKLLSGFLGAFIAMTASGAHADITGAGSTFAAPLYAQWADAYQKVASKKINYQSVGSSAGIKQIIAKTVDFGASDAPLKDADLSKEGLLQFPTAIGGVVPVINVAGVQAGQLVLDGEVLGDIYLGKIKKWNDAALKKLNPTLSLPNEDIAVVRRADGSGTTFIFSNYLSKVNKEWKSKFGEGTTINWPVGMGGKGNEGVATFVQRIPGSIGYVEYAYAKQNKMSYVRMKNEHGTVVEPNYATFQAAAAGAQWSKSFYQILTNQSGEHAWPIAGATFVLIHTADQNQQSLTDVIKFFNWSLKNGKQLAISLDYVPLPEGLVREIHQAWKAKIKGISIE